VIDVLFTEAIWVGHEQPSGVLVGIVAGVGTIIMLPVI
jgi:hypothetical protein